MLEPGLATSGSQRWGPHVCIANIFLRGLAAATFSLGLVHTHLLNKYINNKYIYYLPLNSFSWTWETSSDHRRNS